MCGKAVDTQGRMEGGEGGEEEGIEEGGGGIKGEGIRVIEGDQGVMGGIGEEILGEVIKGGEEEGEIREGSEGDMNSLYPSLPVITSHHHHHHLVPFCFNKYTLLFIIMIQ